MIFKAAQMTQSPGINAAASRNNRGLSINSGGQRTRIVQGLRVSSTAAPTVSRSNDLTLSRSRLFSSMRGGITALFSSSATTTTTTTTGSDQQFDDLAAINDTDTHGDGNSNWTNVSDKDDLRPSETPKNVHGTLKKYLPSHQEQVNNDNGDSTHNESFVSTLPGEVCTSDIQTKPEIVAPDMAHITVIDNEIDEPMPTTTETAVRAITSEEVIMYEEEKKRPGLLRKLFLGCFGRASGEKKSAKKPRSEDEKIVKEIRGYEICLKIERIK